MQQARTVTNRVGGKAKYIGPRPQTHTATPTFWREQQQQKSAKLVVLTQNYFTHFSHTYTLLV